MNDEPRNQSGMNERLCLTCSNLFAVPRGSGDPCPVCKLERIIVAQSGLTSADKRSLARTPEEVPESTDATPPWPHFDENEYTEACGKFAAMLLRKSVCAKPVKHEPDEAISKAVAELAKKHLSIDSILDGFRKDCPELLNPVNACEEREPKFVSITVTGFEALADRNHLIRDVSAIREPPILTLNDFNGRVQWPESIVARAKVGKKGLQCCEVREDWLDRVPPDPKPNEELKKAADMMGLLVEQVQEIPLAEPDEEEWKAVFIKCADVADQGRDPTKTEEALAKFIVVHRKREADYLGEIRETVKQRDEAIDRIEVTEMALGLSKQHCDSRSNERDYVQRLLDKAGQDAGRAAVNTGKILQRFIKAEKEIKRLKNQQASTFGAIMPAGYVLHSSQMVRERAKVVEGLQREADAMEKCMEKWKLKCHDESQAAREALAEVERLSGQINPLATALLGSRFLSGNESACEMAVRILMEQERENAKAIALLRTANEKAHDDDIAAFLKDKE